MKSLHRLSNPVPFENHGADVALANIVLPSWVLQNQRLTQVSSLAIFLHLQVGLPPPHAPIEHVSQSARHIV